MPRNGTEYLCPAALNLLGRFVQCPLSRLVPVGDRQCDDPKQRLAFVVSANVVLRNISAPGKAG